jgi:protein arginine N-methyltransferase 7
MWWVCRMDYEDEILLSCAPIWAHHTPNNMQVRKHNEKTSLNKKQNKILLFNNKWRDHWMQAIYFPNDLIHLEKNQKFFIECNHDEYSLWFNVSHYRPFSNDENQERSLGITMVSRNRLAQLNDTKINDMFLSLLKQVNTAIIS